MVLTTHRGAAARLVVVGVAVEFSPVALVDLAVAAVVQITKPLAAEGLAAAAVVRLVPPALAETAVAVVAVMRLALAEKAQCFCSGLRGINHEIRMD